MQQKEQTQEQFEGRPPPRAYAPPIVERQRSLPEETQEERVKLSLEIRKGSSPFEVTLRAGTHVVTRLLTEKQREISFLVPLELGDNAIEVEVTDGKDVTVTHSWSVKRIK